MDDTIEQFAEIRGKFKLNRGFYEEEMKIISAKVLVKLNLLEMEVKEKMAKVEEKSFLENTAMSMIPKDKEDEEEYKNLITKLKYIKGLKHQF